MACIRPDGTLTQTGRAVLAALAEGSEEEGAARAAGLPLYRVRMVIRALGEARLITAPGDGDGPRTYELTATGREKLQAGG
jgi:DNA-binding transcriptional ArsR family regulator